MFYIIWALVTLAAFGYFFYISVNALIIGGKAIKEKLGRVALMVFVLGLLSFSSGSDHQNDNVDPVTHEIKKWKFTPKDSISGNAELVPLVKYLKTPISTYYIGCEYGVDKKTGKYVPIEAYSTTSGWQLGTSFKTNYIEIEPTDNNLQFRYTISVAMRWHLLGFTFFSDFKEYKGVINLKEIPS